MATNSITSGGMIDVNGLVSSLMTVEKRPLNLLTAKQTSFQSKLSAMGSIKSAVASFQSTMSTLASASSFQTTIANSADTSVFSATAGNGASVGNHSILVSKVAQAQKLATVGQASMTSAIGNGTLTFDFGSIAGGALDPITGTYSGASFTSNGSGTKSVTIGPSNNSLQGIRDAINAAQIGINATIVNDGSGTPYRLALSSSNTGSSNSIKISVAGDPALSNLLSQDPAGVQRLAETATAQNAVLNVDGIAISKANNTITDAISGVTLTLKKPSNSAVALDVAIDNSGLTKSVQSFVDAYNAVNKSLSTALASGVIGSTAPLHGDSLLRSLQSQINSVLQTTLPGGTGTFTSLSQIGVSFQKDGSLALNTTKLSAAITSNVNDIAKVFITPSGGYAAQLNTLATAVLASDGSVTSRTDSLSNSVKDIGKQIDSMNSRMTIIEARLRKQYSALDAMLGKMSTTSNYLATQLSKL